MDKQGSRIAKVSFSDITRPGTSDPITRRDGTPVMQSDETKRLRAELEQARVAIEDMEQRLTQLTQENIDLRARIAEQIRQCAVAERKAEQLIEEISKPRDTEERHELSVALEELQVMQEELQTAHEALARARVTN